MPPNRKPPWLRIRVPAGPACKEVARTLEKYHLHTVCQNALCPNMGECFSEGTATFMIMGNACTRNCRYCGVGHDQPLPLDDDEPQRVGMAVADLGLSYVVITSVTRDDLALDGAKHFARTIEAVKAASPDTRVEVLIPDFMGDRCAIQIVADAGPFVIGHNIEVTRRLFDTARPEGNYQTSLDVLQLVKAAGCTAKSGFMIGLGESQEEIVETMRDLQTVCDILTMGQYLQPTKAHLPVEKFYPPEEFDALAEIARDMGFKHVEAGPLVRSSYHAASYAGGQ